MSKTKTGTSIYIDDALRAPLINFEMEGKTTQATSIYTGTLEQGTINSSGDLSASNRVRTSYIHIKSGSTINISFSGADRYYALFYNSSKQYVSERGWLNSGTSILVPIQASYIRIAISHNDNSDIVPSDVTNLQIGPTPSPDYPSELESVGYENIFNGATWRTCVLSGGLPTSVGGGTTTINSSDSNNVNFSMTSNYDGVVSAAMPVEPSTNYMLSFKLLNGQSTTRINILSYSNYTYTILGNQNVNQTDGNKKYSVSIPDNVTQIVVMIAGTTTKLTNCSATNIQLEKGSQVHSYISPNKYGIEVKTTGKNLAYTSWAEVFVDKINNSSIARIETVDNRNVLRFASSAGYPDYDTNYFIKINWKSNTQYTMSFDIKCTVANISNVGFWYTDGSYQTLEDTISADTWKHVKLTSQANKTIKHIAPIYYNGYSQIDIDTFQLEENNEETIFEPYKENIVTYTLDNPLRSVGDVKDKLYIQDNILYVERKIATRNFDGTENWILYPYNGTAVRRFGITDYDVKANLQMMSNYFACYTQAVGQTSPMGLWTQLQYWVISDADSYWADASALKTWLSTNKPEVQYVLETPTIEILGATDIPHLYKNITHIDTFNINQPTMNVEYINDFLVVDKQALSNNTAAIKCKLIVQEDGELDEIELTENNSIKDWVYTDERLAPNNGFIGQFVGRTLDGNLQNISDDFNILNREIKFMFGVYRISDEETTWYDFGNFIITEPEDNEVNDNTKFESMDYTKKFNVDFNADFTDAIFTQSYNQIINGGGTVTAGWLALYTCKQVGVSLATYVFINSTFEIDNNPFQAGESCRDVMKAIGQLAFSWVRVGWDNRCYIDFNTYNAYGDVSQYDVLDNDQYFSLETLENTQPIDAVGFGMKNINGETAMIIKSGTTGDNVIYLYDNPFLYTYDKRYNAVQAGSILFDFQYNQLKTETIGHPWFVGQECINIKDMENNSKYTYPFNKTIKYNGHIRSDINSIDETEVEKTYGYTSSMEKAARKATIEVDKQNGVITSFTQDVGASLQALSVRQDSQELSINIISTNITMDGENAGDINSVTTKEKRFTFNDNGLSIENNITNYKSLQNETGTYYYDGNNIVGEYTKDGSKQKDLSLFGVYYYGMNDRTDTPDFVAQLYTDNNGVECFGHFWNGGDY